MIKKNMNYPKVRTRNDLITATIALCGKTELDYLQCIIGSFLKQDIENWKKVKERLPTDHVPECLWYSFDRNLLQSFIMNKDFCLK